MCHFDRRMCGPGGLSLRGAGRAVPALSLVQGDGCGGSLGWVCLGDDCESDGVAGHRNRRGRGVEIVAWESICDRADCAIGCRASGDAVDLPGERVVDVANGITGELLRGVEGDGRGGRGEADGDGRLDLGHPPSRTLDTGVPPIPLSNCFIPSLLA
jgi:hypothetical protein